MRRSKNVTIREIKVLAWWEDAQSHVLLAHRHPLANIFRRIVWAAGCVYEVWLGVEMRHHEHHGANAHYNGACRNHTSANRHRKVREKPTNGDPERDVLATTQVANEDYGEDVAYFIGWGNEARVAGWDLKSLLDRRYYRADVARGQGLLEGH